MTKRRSLLQAAAAVALLAILLATAWTNVVPSTAGTRLPAPEDRYALAGGCYVVRSLASGTYIGRGPDTFVAGMTQSNAEPFHFQATDLGRYLLFGAAEDFLAASEGAAGTAAYAVTKSDPGNMAGGLTTGATDAVADDVATGDAGTATGRGVSIVAAARPSELADWEIDEVDSVADAFTIALPATGQSLVVEDGTLQLADGADTTPRARFAFALASGGCAEYPEIEVNVEGPIAGGSSLVGETRGYIDLHLHMMAFEFIGGRVRCGRPWHPYGVAHALVDCPDHGPHGETAVLEMVLSGGNPVSGHDTDGWPTFAGWPRPGSLTHEQVYYKWLERAWRGGLRFMTNLLVDNHALCVVYPFKKNSCNEMDGVRLQAQRLREMERYIDAQAGGPGEGWFRIITDPFQARKVINDGKLAVMMGIEVSTPFDCNVDQDKPLCSEADIVEEIDAVYDLGVRQMELANKFDNALTGVTGDAEATGVVVNSGNRSETGHYWRMGTCPEGELPEGARDKLQYNARDQGAPNEIAGRDGIFGAVLEMSGTSGVAPVYPQGPHCNTIGLTPLGEFAVNYMIQKGMVFDPDHMSARARHQALDILEEKGYSGAVSSHSWSDDTIYPRILELGGVVTPHAGSSGSFAAKWDKLRTQADPRYYFGLGYGSDVNGFSAQGAPRYPSLASAVAYPIAGFGGATIHRQVSGTRTYNINTDGVAHYGLYPDWVEDLRKIRGSAIVADLERGTEAMLQMWERAVGVKPDACREDVPDLPDLAGVSAGMTWIDVLKAAGQPSSRAGGQFSYCLTDGQTGTVAFDAAGVVTTVTIA